MSIIHRLRKPVASTTALSQRKRVLTVAIVVALAIAGALAYLLAGCGGGNSATPPPPPPPVTFQALTATEVTNIATAAADSVSTDTLVIAGVDRQWNEVAGNHHGQKRYERFGRDGGESRRDSNLPRERARGRNRSDRRNDGCGRVRGVCGRNFERIRRIFRRVATAGRGFLGRSGAAG